MFAVGKGAGMKPLETEVPHVQKRCHLLLIALLMCYTGSLPLETGGQISVYTQTALNQ